MGYVCLWLIIAIIGYMMDRKRLKDQYDKAMARRKSMAWNLICTIEFNKCNPDFSELEEILNTFNIPVGEREK